MTQENAALELTTAIASEMLEHVYSDTILSFDTDGNVSYTDGAQEVFNMLHDQLENIVDHFNIELSEGSDG